MTYMMLYEEESQGLEGPEKVSTRWPARCHVTRHVHVAELKETAQVPPLLTKYYIPTFLLISLRTSLLILLYIP